MMKHNEIQNNINFTAAGSTPFVSFYANSEVKTFLSVELKIWIMKYEAN